MPSIIFNLAIASPILNKRISENSFSYFCMQLQEEILRCEELKAANIRQVIEGARRQLHEWWDKCFFTEEQRNVFTPLLSG